ncbi:hypothetical protein HTZ84_05380 [Haloterrigena sp. SYSU A558-1]|uniref:Uncharacterized protein n=1 Tax=Haloterrigena gelatinilytica TaxID=2741724 RepID=A0ABX2LG87_9EURY|nr:hypothetical protein [Haloterrigena gelatinilytica]NUC71746.1 hypothetical protein [Haloterrigena gelatinilytica]
MNTNEDHDENANGTNSTNLAETVGVVRSALARLEDNSDQPSCQAHVEETGYYVLKDPSNGGAWIRTQDIEEVRC